MTASTAVPFPVSFTFRTGIVGFGAEPGVDHLPVDTQVELPAGATEVVVAVPLVGDDIDEADELLFGYILDLSVGHTGLDGGTAVGRILDDDGPGEGPAPGKDGAFEGGGFTTAPPTPGQTERPRLRTNPS